MAKKTESACGDKVLAILVIILAIIVMVNMALHYQDYIPASKQSDTNYYSSQTPISTQTKTTYSGQKVELDYLYANWCSYCSLTTPTLNSVVMKLGPAVTLNPYEESMRKTDLAVKALYEDYKARRLFTLFPTIVARGPKGEASMAGLMTNETVLMSWVCSQYTVAPAACK